MEYVEREESDDEFDEVCGGMFLWLLAAECVKEILLFCLTSKFQSR